MKYLHTYIFLERIHHSSNGSVVSARMAKTQSTRQNSLHCSRQDLHTGEMKIPTDPSTNKPLISFKEARNKQFIQENKEQCTPVPVKDSLTSTEMEKVTSWKTLGRGKKRERGIKERYSMKITKTPPLSPSPYDLKKNPVGTLETRISGRGSTWINLKYLLFLISLLEYDEKQRHY